MKISTQLKEFSDITQNIFAYLYVTASYSDVCWKEISLYHAYIFFVSLQVPMHALRNISYTNVKVSKKCMKKTRTKKSDKKVNTILKIRVWT